MNGEFWTDPRTGLRHRRHSLGWVFSGVLSIQVCDKSDGLDLLWSGADLPVLCNPDLRKLIALSWKRLELLTGRRLSKPWPIAVTNRLRTWWLARLVAGDYLVESGGDGRSELFEVMPAAEGARILLTHPRYRDLHISARIRDEHPADARWRARLPIARPSQRPPGSG